MIKKISGNVWKFYFSSFGSNVYLIKLKNKLILIDTSSTANQEELISNLEELNIKPSEIEIIILTHNHWDHTGNISLFDYAKFYGEKKDFEEDFILPIEKLNIKEFEIIKTPGHTHGSLCILYNEILFSGDTIFHNGGIGRTDFENSSEKEMINSLKKLQKINFRILCPGH